MMIINNALTDMNNVTNRFANQPTANSKRANWQTSRQHGTLRTSKNCVKYKYSCAIFLFFFFVSGCTACGNRSWGVECWGVGRIRLKGWGEWELRQSIKTIWMRRWRWWVWVKSGSSSSQLVSQSGQ